MSAARSHERCSACNLAVEHLSAVALDVGALLNTHVDRPATHIVSAILNIAKQAHSPWPIGDRSGVARCATWRSGCDASIPWIGIRSHDRKLYRYPLEPGRMVLYESARCLHGKAHRFNGTEYANLFVHFKPANRSLIRRKYPYTHSQAK